MNGRLFYLDALRSFCMLYGVFVHTSAFLGPDAIGLISLVSRYFRMDTFFLVSGFLVALVAARTSVPAVLRRRSTALLVPLAAMVLLFNPLTCWLIHLRHAGPMSLGDFLFGGGWRTPAGAVASWLLHLWFLISLWVYVMLFPAIGRVAAAVGVRHRLEALARWPAEALILGVAAGVAVTAVGLRVASVFTLEPLVEGTPFEWVTLATVVHLPYFVLGVLLHAAPALFERMHRVSLVTLGLGLGLVVVERRLGLPGPAGGVIEVIARAVLTVGLVTALLWVARSLVAGPGRLLGTLTDSIYTVYLFHYVTIYALGLLLLRVVPAGPIYYLILSPLVILLLVAFHHYVVARNPALRLLFNGRPPAAPVRTPAE
jgi:glucan biosynthesis protein C